MTAVQTERLPQYHLNGIDPHEAKNLGVESLVQKRVTSAGRVLEAVAAMNPEHVRGAVQLYDFEMRLNRFTAEHRLAPVNITADLIWNLVKRKMQDEKRMSLDGNTTQLEREQTAREMVEDPNRAEAEIGRQMELGAVVRFPQGSAYAGHRTKPEIYHKYGVHVSDAGKPRAGFFVPFQQGYSGYDMYTPEINIGIYGLMGNVLKHREYSHLFVEASEHAQIGRGRRFFETPAFYDPQDGHIVAMAYPTESDIIYGMQFDDPKFLASLTFAGIMQLEDVREVGRINRAVHQTIQGSL